MPKICRHCQLTAANRPRDLCWSCYYTAGVRTLYPSTSKFSRRGVGNRKGDLPLPPEPTSAEPGSPEKVAVPEERARQHLSRWHPRDTTIDLT
jgi:hypothetical protein